MRNRPLKNAERANAITQNTPTQNTPTQNTPTPNTPTPNTPTPNTPTPNTPTPKRYPSPDRMPTTPVRIIAIEIAARKRLATFPIAREAPVPMMPMTAGPK